MNKVEKLFLASLAAAALTLAFSSCNNDDDKTDGIDKQNAELEAVAKQYVGSTVNLTYSLLATETQKLYEDLLALKTKMKGGASASQSEIDDICAEFLLARGYYEESEAFLFGAATDFGIDPPHRHLAARPARPSRCAQQQDSDGQPGRRKRGRRNRLCRRETGSGTFRLSRNRIRDIPGWKEPRGISLQWQ